MAEARQSMICRKQERWDIEFVSRKYLPNHLAQDRSKRMVIFGSDVVSLYLNLRWLEAG